MKTIRIGMGLIALLLLSWAGASEPVDEAPAAAAAGGCCGACCGDCTEYGAGNGAGRGWRRGAGPGPGGSDHHVNIHALLDQHELIERRVEDVEGGVSTVTTSEDPEVAERIREHVRQMQSRVESGQGLRYWDPLFVELFARHDEIRMEIEDVEGGVRVRETSEDPEVARLIRQHAWRGVSEFVEDGHTRARQATPLPEGYVAETSTGGGRGRGCRRAAP